MSKKKNANKLINELKSTVLHEFKQNRHIQKTAKDIRLTSKK